MKYSIILLVIVAMAFQVTLGQLTGQGQGSIGILLFILLVELHPKYSFRFLAKRIVQKINDNRGEEL